MRVAIIQFASASIHIGASLEILHNESMENDSFYCYWGNSTSYPGRMSTNYESFSNHFPTKLRRLVREASPEVILNSKVESDTEWVELRLRAFMAQMEKITFVYELVSLNYDSISPGSALANELTTLLKNRDIDFKKNRKIIEILIRSYLEVYQSTKNLLERNNINRLYVFNGRFLHERAVWDASKLKHIETMLFETTRNRYHVRKKGFHDRINNQIEMINFWDQSKLTLEEKISSGSKYFELLRSKSNPFLSHGGSEFTTDKPYFVYFSNSDDEAVGFWESWDEKLGSQIQVVKKLQEFFDQQDEVSLVIRLHPNLQNKSYAQRRDWNLIKETKNSKVISADSKTSSYDLLDNSRGVITFGSTIGLEAAFSKKPSLLLADSGYDELEVCDKPKNWDEVFRWINTSHILSQKELEHRSNRACIRGLYLELAGKPFEYSELRETGWGAWQVLKFRDRRMNISRFVIVYHRIISRLKFKRISRLINEQ